MKKILNVLLINVFGMIFYYIFIFISYYFGLSSHIFDDFKAFLSDFTLVFIFLILFDIIYIYAFKSYYSILLYIIFGILFDQLYRIYFLIIKNVCIYYDLSSFISLLTINIFLIIFIGYSIHYYLFLQKQLKLNRSLPEPIHDKFN